MPKPRVLFLCTGNSARSQMAEGFLRNLAGERFEAISAGIDPTVVNPLAIRAMAEIGIDISQQRSKSAGSLLKEPLQLGYLITVCDNAKERCPIFPGVVKRIHWPLEDPAAAAGTEAERLAVFRRIRDEVGRHVQSFIDDARGV